MEDFNYNRSRSHGNGQMMKMERYYGGATPPPRPCDLRSYSVSYAQAQMGPNNYNNKDLKMMKKGKSMSSRATSISKSWSFATDPEIQRKKRVASYKMYSVEGKVKGSFRKSFRWLKDRYDENHETGQIQAKGPSGEGQRPKWRRTKPPSGEG
ncbi:hypothetical protein AAZX31_14G096900 [Glycine max]